MTKGGPQYLSPGALPAFRLGDLCDVTSDVSDVEEDEGISSMSISPMSSMSLRQQQPDINGHLLFAEKASASKHSNLRLLQPDDNVTSLEQTFHHNNRHSVIIVTTPPDE